MVTLKTSCGDIRIELFEKEAPETVKNFLAYVDSGFYRDTLFHRVIPDFMIPTWPTLPPRSLMVSSTSKTPFAASITPVSPCWPPIVA